MVGVRNGRRKEWTDLEEGESEGGEGRKKGTALDFL